MQCSSGGVRMIVYGDTYIPRYLQIDRYVHQVEMRTYTYNKHSALLHETSKGQVFQR